MARVKIDNVGSVGIIEDVPDHMLPPEAITSGNNVRFLDNSVKKLNGYAEVMATPNTAPYHLQMVLYEGEVYWVYAGLTAIGAHNSSTHADITNSGGAYTATADDYWTMGNLGGLLIANNYKDTPQYWAQPSLSQLMQDVPNWPSGYKCKAMVPYKQHLFALGVEQGGTLYPHRVLWSDLADPGAMPSSWDISDATKDAGEQDLSDVNSGGLVNGHQLGPGLLLYKENSVWLCEPSNDIFVFNFSTLFTNLGLAAPHAVSVVPKRREHVVFTGDDVVRHNGQEAESVLTSRFRRSLRNTLDSTYYSRSFTVVNRLHQEIWFCYPTSGNTHPNAALVINYETGAVSERSLPATPHIAVGLIDESSSTLWNDQNVTWDSYDGTWGGSLSADALAQQLLMADAANTKLFRMNTTNQEDGMNMSSFVERTGLPFIGHDRNGQPKADFTTRKVVSRIWPKMSGGKVTIKALAQEEAGGVVTYSAGMDFDPSTDRYVDLPQPLSGLFLGLRVESNTDVAWTLYGYDMEVETLGEF